MALPIPVLDNTTFDDLVNEARQLIPQYSSKWTDHNVHDPGITLIELFAWLAEMQIYQLDQVTDDQYRSFVKLVGLSLLPLQPASVEIAFEVPQSERDLLITAGTKLVPIGKDEFVFETARDVFLSPSRLEAVFSSYDNKVVDQSQTNNKADIDFAPFGDQAPVNAALHLGFDKWFESWEIHLHIQLFEGGLPEPGHFPGKPPQVTPSVELQWEYGNGENWQPLTVIDDATEQFTKSGRLVFQTPDSQPQRGRGLSRKHLHWIRARVSQGGYEIVPRINAIRLNSLLAIQVETVINETLGTGNDRSGHTVKLAKPPVELPIELNSAARPLRFYVGSILNWDGFLARLRQFDQDTEPSPGQRIWSKLDASTQGLIRVDLPDAQPARDNRQYTLINGLNQLLGITDLYERNTFASVEIPIVHQPLISKLPNRISAAELAQLNRSLIERACPNLIVPSGLAIQVRTRRGEWQDWYQVDDFTSSGPHDRHYTLDAPQREITFGNGLNGRVPQSSEQIRALHYKTSLGPQGNLAAQQRWRLLPAEFFGLRGENRQAAREGKLAESVDEAKKRVRSDFRARYRAITSDDFEILAKATPGLRVARVKTLPNYHPQFPCLDMPGSVTVVVVPYARRNTLKPTPSDGFLQTVQRHLEAHRLITTDLHVIRPEYMRISVVGTLHLRRQNTPEQVLQQAEADLKRFLHALTGGPDKTGWTLGRPVFLSEIYQLLDQVEGVDYVTGVELRGEAADYCRATRLNPEGGGIELPRNGLVYSGTHNLQIGTP